jgi:hypothetical protein
MQAMPEITLNTNRQKLVGEAIVPQEERLQYQQFSDLLYLVAALFVNNGAPASDVSLIQKDILSFGSTEPVQINCWWTPAETWETDAMLDMSAWATAITIDSLNLPTGMCASSTLEQKGVDPKYNKTVFVIGQRISQKEILITQDVPVCDDQGKLIRHLSVDKVISQEDLNSLTTSLGLIATNMLKSLS